MKPKTKRSLLVVILVLIVVAILVFALTRSSSYNAPKKPAVSQTTISKQLASKAGNSVASNVSQSAAKQPAAPAAPAPSPSPAAPTPTPAATPVLTNTGPGSVVALFGITFIAATAAWYRRCWRTVRSN